MNGNLFGVVLLFLAMAIVSKLMALPQIHKLNKQLMEIKRSGPVSSVGMARHWRGNRAYVLVTDLQGNIVCGIRQAAIRCFPDSGKTGNSKKPTIWRL